MASSLVGLDGLLLGDELLSEKQIKKIVALNAPLANYLKAFASEDIYHRVWHFDGDAVIDDFWTLSADATATPFAPVASGFGITGSTGTTDNGGLSMFGKPVLKGDKVAGIHVHFEVDEVDDLQMEFGLVSAVTDKTLPVVTDVDTPAVGNGATYAAVVHMDTDQTLQTMAIVGDNNVAVTKTNMGILAPTAATLHCVRLALKGDDIVSVFDGKRANRYVLDNGVDGAQFLAPWIFFACKAGSDAKAPTVRLVELFGGK